MHRFKAVVGAGRLLCYSAGNGVGQLPGTSTSAEQPTSNLTVSPGIAPV